MFQGEQMKFDEEFISKIDDNPIGAIVEACISTLEYLEMQSQGQWTRGEQDMLMETAALVSTIIESNSLVTDYQIPESVGKMDQNCNNLNNYLSAIRQEFEGHATDLQLKSYKKRFQTALKSNFAYEFSQGDLDRVQVLVNELRAQINDSVALEPEHKQRLLKRLESLQSEMHKRVSDLDRFWGMVGDAGVILGKLGTDAKPIVDRVKEIAEIVWRTQARTEELPSDSPSPLLEHHDET
jgi:hypothetical protein